MIGSFGESVITCDRAGISAATLANPTPDLVEALTYGEFVERVSAKSSLGASALAYCVNVIANDIGQLPLMLYRIEGDDDQKEEDRSHPGGKVLRIPRGPWTGYQLKRSLQLDALLYGNGRAYIKRNLRGEPAELIPLPPERTVTVTSQGRPFESPVKWHVVMEPNSSNYDTLPDRDVLHIYAAGLDKYQGTAALDQFRGAIGLTLAGEKFANSFFKNNGQPSLVLSAPPGVFRDESKAQEFLNNFNDRHSGSSNAGKAALLREGITASTLSSALRENQIIEQREFQVREAMRMFGVHMVPGVSDSQSYNTLEQHNRAYLIHGLGPWQAIWASECTAKLLTAAEANAETYLFAWDNWELIKPDAANRAAMLVNLVRGMIITPNEARDWEELPPLDGGDQLINPATTTSKDMASPRLNGEPPESNPPPAAMVAKVRSWLVAAGREVSRMADKARNFADWSDQFYAKHAAKFPGGVDVATHVVDCHKAQLHDLASLTSDKFPAAVLAACKEWPSEAESIARQIMEESDDG
jgi:HK97 family phage portal protein